MDRRRPSLLLVWFRRARTRDGMRRRRIAGLRQGGALASQTSGSGGNGSGGTTGAGGAATGGATGSGGAPAQAAGQPDPVARRRPAGRPGAAVASAAAARRAAAARDGRQGRRGGAAGSAGAKGTGGAAGSAGAKGTGGATGMGGTAGHRRASGAGGATGQQPFKGFAGDPTACADMQHLNVSWYYNWKQTPSSRLLEHGHPVRADDLGAHGQRAERVRDRQRGLVVREQGVRVRARVQRARQQHAVEHRRSRPRSRSGRRSTTAPSVGDAGDAGELDRADLVQQLHDLAQRQLDPSRRFHRAALVRLERRARATQRPRSSRATSNGRRGSRATARSGSPSGGA